MKHFIKLADHMQNLHDIIQIYVILLKDILQILSLLFSDGPIFPYPIQILKDISLAKKLNVTGNQYSNHTYLPAFS